MEFTNNMNQEWKQAFITPPKPANFPILGKLTIDSQKSPESCHYFVIYCKEEMKFRVGRNDFLWKSIENI